MKKYKGLMVGIMVFALLIAGAGALYTKLSEEYGTPGNLMVKEETEPAEEPMAVEQEKEEKVYLAMDFAMEDAAGNTVSLYDFLGKPIVLNFWASWCGPCKREMPGFQKAYETYGEEVEFLMVNLTDGARETREMAIEYLEKEGYTFPAYFDTKQEGIYTYAVYSVPTTFFINGAGELITWARGAISEENLEAGISMICELP